MDDEKIRKEEEFENKSDDVEDAENAESVEIIDENGSESTMKLPLLPLRGMVVFPFMIVHLDVGRDRSVAALDETMVNNRKVFLVAQKNDDTDSPTMEDLYEVGTIAEIRQLIKTAIYEYSLKAYRGRVWKVSRSSKNMTRQR